jgi:ABC-type Mn2+/Zn2+ transport system ATPase subunit
MAVPVSSDDRRCAGASVLCRELMVAFGNEIALSAVTFGVEPGQLVAIIGPKGAGKSTLLKAIVGVVPLTGGAIEIDRKPASQMRCDIAYVSRQVRIDWSLPISATDVVMMGRYRRLGWLGRPGVEDYHKTDLAIELLGLTHVRNRWIGDLSIGQQQRLLLARALAQEPRVLLIDEPFSGVDLASRIAILEILSDQHQIGRTILLVTDDLSYAAHCDLVLLLDRELIHVGIPDEVFRPGVLSEAYDGRMFLLKGRR